MKNLGSLQHLVQPRAVGDDWHIHWRRNVVAAIYQG
jgi:hypothetical protein